MAGGINNDNYNSVGHWDILDKPHSVVSLGGAGHLSKNVYGTKTQGLQPVLHRMPTATKCLSPNVTMPNIRGKLLNQN